MKATKRQIGYICGLLRNQGEDAHKEDFQDLSAAQANDMIRSLARKDAFNAEDKMKGKILAMSHTIGWEKGNGRIDMARVDNWCLKYGKFHKKLDAHSYKELSELATQFQEGPFKYKLTH